MSQEKPWGCALRFDDLIPDRVTNEFTHGVQFEFPHNIGAMSLGGFYADAQGNRHFLAAFPSANS